MKIVMSVLIVLILSSCGEDICMGSDNVSNKDSEDIKIEFKNSQAGPQKVFFRNGSFYCSFSYKNQDYAICKCNLIKNKDNDPIACVPNGIVIYSMPDLKSRSFFEVDCGEYYSSTHIYDYFEKNGRMVDFDSLGRVISYGNWKRNLRNGKFLHFDSNGKVTKLEIFRNDTLITVW